MCVQQHPLQLLHHLTCIHTPADALRRKPRDAVRIREIRNCCYYVERIIKGVIDWRIKFKILDPENNSVQCTQVSLIHDYIHHLLHQCMFIKAKNMLLLSKILLLNTRIANINSQKSPFNVFLVCLSNTHVIDLLWTHGLVRGRVLGKQSRQTETTA